MNVFEKMFNMMNLMMVVILFADSPSCLQSPIAAIE